MRSILCGLLFTSFTLSVVAGDWPQFRGPGGLGIANESDLPVQWNETKNIRWKVDLPGRGLSSPVVIGKRLFLTACSGWEQKRLHVFCFDADTGKQLWHRQIWATGSTVCNKATSMAAPTPVADKEVVVALFASFDLVCFDHDGNLQWTRSLTNDYTTVGNNVGAAASPLLWQELVILDIGNAGESFAVGIDKHTG